MSSFIPAIEGREAPLQDAPALLVADIGGTHLRLGRYREDGGCTALCNVPTPSQDWTAFAAALEHLVHPYRAGAAALSISIAGVVSPQNGVVTAANIPALSGRPVAHLLQAQLGLPVVVTNDADCAALAEATLGAGAGHDPVFCAILGTGVGGGLVLGGRLLTGAGGIAGEWGHGPVLLDSTVSSTDGRRWTVPRLRCGCGQWGCLDTLGGARGLERLHAAMHGEALGSHQILAAWHADASAARATLDVYLTLMAGPLALVVNLTGAACVPVGGGLGNDAGLVAALDQAVRERMLRRCDTPLLVPGRLGEQAGLLGAACAAHGLLA